MLFEKAPSGNRAERGFYLFPQKCIITVFAFGLAKLCLPIGNVLPSYWQSLAIVMAKQ